MANRVKSFRLVKIKHIIIIIYIAKRDCFYYIDKNFLNRSTGGEAFLCPASDSVNYTLQPSVYSFRDYFINTVKKRDRAPVFNQSSVPLFRNQFEAGCTKTRGEFALIEAAMGVK